MRLELAELEHLYRLLSPEVREELLQCLLVTPARGGEAIIKVLGQLLLCHTTDTPLWEGGPS